MSKKLKICFFTGTRAEYGLLRNLILLFNKDKDVEIQMIVTGSHLSKRYGSTVNEIKKDKIKINKTIRILNKKDDAFSILKSTSKALLKSSEELSKARPNAIVILGDRYEAFAAAIASHFLQIPICHFHGGELTEGIIDESIRHSITKMATLHFVANSTYKKRVIQLGEKPRNIYNVGGMGIDAIKKMNFLTKNELECDLDIKFQKKIFLITYHPLTLGKEQAELDVRNLLLALEKFEETTLVFTSPNADKNNLIIFKKMKQYIRNKKNAYFFTSLGQTRYLSLLKYSDAVIGNSSSGILEAPYLKIPTVNIGPRQNGRVKTPSIINSKSDTNNIIKSINLSLSTRHKAICKKKNNDYDGKGGSILAYKIIKKKLKTMNNEKKFYDINFTI